MKIFKGDNTVIVCDPMLIGYKDLMEVLIGLEGAGYNIDTAVTCNSCNSLRGGQTHISSLLATYRRFSGLFEIVLSDEAIAEGGGIMLDGNLAKRYDITSLGAVVWDDTNNLCPKASDITDALLTVNVNLDGVGPIRHGSVKIRGATVICGMEGVGKHDVVAHVDGTRVCNIDALGRVKDYGTAIWEFPETHRHPAAQVELAKQIHRVINKKRLNVLMTTYSTYFLRALEIYKEWTDDIESTDDAPVWHKNPFRLYGMGKYDDGSGQSFIVDCTDCSKEIYAEFYLPLEEL